MWCLRIARVGLVSAAFVGLLTCAPAWGSKPAPVAIAIHGGAGVIDRAQMTPEREQA
jgi:hypothetical protein